LPPSITSRPVKIHVRQIKISELFGGARLGGVLGGISWRIEQIAGHSSAKINNCPALKRFEVGACSSALFCAAAEWKRVF
ncbi:MAG: hypothetical protein IKC51_02490, partial [Myxococcaceae bacterium]|nr:hypothetical protein [Myxococcaceae bacterium]